MKVGTVGAAVRSDKIAREHYPRRFDSFGAQIEHHHDLAIPSTASTRGLLGAPSGATEGALRTSECLRSAICSTTGLGDWTSNFANAAIRQKQILLIVPAPTDHGDEISRVGAALKVDRVPGFDSVEDTLWTGWQASSDRRIKRGVVTSACSRQNMQSCTLLYVFQLRPFPAKKRRRSPKFCLRRRIAISHEATGGYTLSYLGDRPWPLGKASSTPSRPRPRQDQGHFKTKATVGEYPLFSLRRGLSYHTILLYSHE